MYEKCYGTARLVLGIVAITGWVVLAVGMVVLVWSFVESGGVSWQVMLAGIVMFASGLILVATSQVSFAVLDQADISRANLVLLRKIADAQGVSLKSNVKGPTAGTGSPARQEPNLLSSE